MTDLQMKQIRDSIRAKGYGWTKGGYVKPPKRYRIIEKQLDCIEMINSILAYDCCGYTDAEKVLQQQENSYRNYLTDYVKLLGRKMVIELIKGQIDSIKRVEHCVYTDGEGCTYNSIIWKEN